MDSFHYIRLHINKLHSCVKQYIHLKYLHIYSMAATLQKEAKN